MGDDIATCWFLWIGIEHGHTAVYLRYDLIGDNHRHTVLHMLRKVSLLFRQYELHVLRQRDVEAGVRTEPDGFGVRRVHRGRHSRYGRVTWRYPRSRWQIYPIHDISSMPWRAECRILTEPATSCMLLESEVKSDGRCYRRAHRRCYPGFVHHRAKI